MSRVRVSRVPCVSVAAAVDGLSGGCTGARSAELGFLAYTSGPAVEMVYTFPEPGDYVR